MISQDYYQSVSSMINKGFTAKPYSSRATSTKLHKKIYVWKLKLPFCKDRKIGNIEKMINSSEELTLVVKPE